MTRRQVARQTKSASTPEEMYSNDVVREVKSVFGIDNAKQLPRSDAVKYFIPQQNFAQLFSAKNHILLGSRGSGKTTWIRMMAHDHVKLAAKNSNTRFSYARDALRDNLIGIYIPASAAFAGDLKNKPWQTEQEQEEYFVWRLNLHSCSALTHIIESCVEQYVENRAARLEAVLDICHALSAQWDGSDRDPASTPQGLRLRLSSVEMAHQLALRKRTVGNADAEPHVDYFSVDLLEPLKYAIQVISERLSVPEGAVWMVCLDEVEYLTPLHHRILNTQIRTASGNLVFKLATMPFAHHTLATNIGDPVREGNDFEYVYVDHEAIDSRGNQAESDFLRFARELFQHRIASRAPKLGSLTLKDLLGPSPLIDDRPTQFAGDREKFMQLLRRHANPATVTRAERLQNSEKFKSEIVRKMNGALFLRDAIDGSHGNSRMRVYSGELLVVRCSDGNPRRLMRIINALIQKMVFDERRGVALIPIEPAAQNEVLERIARDTLNRTQSEPPEGQITHAFLSAIGAFMRWNFSSSHRRIGTDQVTSVEIRSEDGPRAQQFIKQAIQLSLMIPAKAVPFSVGNQDCVGTFHLAFLFAPYFRILPRRNDSVRLPRVLSHSEQITDTSVQRSLL